MVPTNRGSKVKKIRTFFSGSPIQRSSKLRADSDDLYRAYRHPDTRFLPVWQSRCLVAEQRAVLLGKSELSAYTDGPDDVIFLGRLDERFIFALALPDHADPAGTAQAEFIEVRKLIGQVDETDAGLLAYARAMVNWQQSHAYCGICGTRNQAIEGGFVMQCGDVNCAQRSFPRLDPAIIVLVIDRALCLLGRQPSWPEGQFSTIAGFVEPGESLEDAVRREVAEETNIAVGDCRYLASQPWPFPSALMIGFHAEAGSQSIRLNDAELAEARWISREQIVEREVMLPPSASVAYRLIEAWFDSGSDQPLDALVPAASSWRRR
jgi:NAD+ diphosphatase